MTEGADEAPVEEQKKLIRERYSKLPFAKLSADKFGAGKTAEFFDDPAWKELSESCLGCRERAPLSARHASATI